MLESYIWLLINLIWAGAVCFGLFVAREWLRRDSRVVDVVSALQGKVAQLDIILKAVRADVERMNNVPVRRTNF